MIDVLQLVAGLVLLVSGADLLIKGASSIAKRFNVSEAVTGLTVVAFGTSLPELIVSVTATLKGSSNIAVGNVMGSNLANLLLILGISSLIFPLRVQPATLKIELPFSVVALLLTGFLALTAFLPGEQPEFLGVYDGASLLLLFAGFMLYVRYTVKQQAVDSQPEQMPKSAQWKAIFFIVAGVAGLYLGGNWTIEGALAITRGWGLSESFVGLTVVAVGTSLPELAASAMAAWRKNSALAVGNVVGSNIFNLLWILGASSLLRPLAFAETESFTVLAIFWASVLLGIAAASSRTNTMGRGWGAAFLVLYGLCLYIFAVG